MHHLLAWGGAKTDSTAGELAPVVQDQVVVTNAAGNAYLMPLAGTIIYGGVLNDTITRAWFTLPSMRDLGNPEVSPLIQTATPSANFSTWNPGMFGIPFKKSEELSMYSSNGASTVDFVYGCALITDGIKPTPSGRRFTVTGTAAQTLVANAWTQAQITLDQNLPYGLYAVCGMRVICAAAQFGRLIFPNMLQYRPGIVVGGTELVRDFKQVGRFGDLGEWGRFEQTAPPALQILGSTAGAQTPRVYLDMVAMTGALAA